MMADKFVSTKGLDYEPPSVPKEPKPTPAVDDGPTYQPDFTLVQTVRTYHVPGVTVKEARQIIEDFGEGNVKEANVFPGSVIQVVTSEGNPTQ